MRDIEMQCKTCPFFVQSTMFPRWGDCELFGGDGVKANQPQCESQKQVSKPAIK